MPQALASNAKDPILGHLGPPVHSKMRLSQHSQHEGCERCIQRCPLRAHWRASRGSPVIATCSASTAHVVATLDVAWMAELSLRRAICSECVRCAQRAERHCYEHARHEQYVHGCMAGRAGCQLRYHPRALAPFLASLQASKHVCAVLPWSSESTPNECARCSTTRLTFDMRSSFGQGSEVEACHAHIATARE